MNRRSFLKTTATIPAVLALAPSVLMEGCTTTQLEQAVNTVLTEAINVLAVAEPGAAFVPELQKAIAALKQAEATWQGGGDVAIIDSALNTIEAVTAVIPLTAVYSPLIDVLVAAIEAALSLIPQPAVKAMSVRAIPANPHIGRVQKPKSVKESIAQYNTAVLANPELAAAKI